MEAVDGRQSEVPSQSVIAAAPDEGSATDASPLRGSCWWDHPREAALSGPRTLKPFPQPWSWMGRITYPGVT